MPAQSGAQPEASPAAHRRHPFVGPRSFGPLYGIAYTCPLQRVGEVMSSAKAEGGCLCGSIRYRIAGTPTAQALCHCRSCRLAAGAPSVAWIVVRREQFAFTKGAPAQFRSSPSVVRTFCGQCGTALTYQHDVSPNTIDVTSATLDAPEDFPPTREIWLEHRLAWEPLDENLQHFQRGGSDA